MKVSYNWLNHHFHAHEGRERGTGIVLPSPEKLAEKLTFRAYQVESIEKKGNDFVLDIDVLPNRAHDSLSHRGVAREIGRILGKPVYKDKITERKPNSAKKPLITIEDKRCRRYTGIVVEGLKIGPSPAWLKERLETLGQRSINNIVDLTNFVMLETGQPLHAFDTDKLSKDEKGNPQIIVRGSAGGKMTTLDNKEVILDKETMVIADKKQVLAIAGIKGGKAAEVTPETKSILIESANFDLVSIRKASRKINIRTDSSYRFEHDISPELTKESLELAVELIVNYCGDKNTKISEITDIYPAKSDYVYKIGVSVAEVNNLLGTKLSEKDISKILSALNFPYIYAEVKGAIESHIPQILGKPYKRPTSMRMDTPNFFSCSSLISYLFVQAGVFMPSLCIDKYAYGEPVPKEKLEFGDLVFSNSGEGKAYYESTEYLPGKIKVPAGIDHVGLYLGGGKILQATQSKGKVVMETLEGNAQFKNIVGYRRMANMKEKRFVVSIPSERLDLVSSGRPFSSGIKEDLIEEIGRMYGYENIKAVKPKAALNKPEASKEFYYTNKIREILSNEGFSEVMTQSFSQKGEIELENPLAQNKRFLRNNLEDDLMESFHLNLKNKSLLGLSGIKIFEIGKIFKNNMELLEIGIIYNDNNRGVNNIRDSMPVIEKELGHKISYRIGILGSFSTNLSADIDNLPAPTSYKFLPTKQDIKYKPISSYPFALRDIAVFVPEKIKAEEVKKIISKEAGELLVRSDLFDEFKKESRISYAFHLVFQSHEKTLSDEEINRIMEKITKKLNSKTGWQVR